MAQEFDLTIDKGSDVTVQFDLVETDGSAKDLTNHTFSSKIKKSYNTSDSDATPFTTTIPSPATDGKVLLTLTNLQTDALKAGRHVYDVEMAFTDSDSNTVIERIVEGKIFVTPSVT